MRSHPPIRMAIGCKRSSGLLDPPEGGSSLGSEQLTIRFELMKLIDRGLTIDGEKAPYSPNSTGNNKKRAILDRCDGGS